MDLVAAERLHSEPLLQIKATSHRKRGEARPDGCESTEAVYAVYPSVICFLPGFSLFQTLRSCRSQVPNTYFNSSCYLLINRKVFCFLWLID